MNNKLSNKNYNFVVIECGCERVQICIADKEGENYKAFKYMNKYKGKKCKSCGQKLIINIFHEK